MKSRRRILWLTACVAILLTLFVTVRQLVLLPAESNFRLHQVAFEVAEAKDIENQTDSIVELAAMKRGVDVMKVHKISGGFEFLLHDRGHQKWFVVYTRVGPEGGEQVVAMLARE